MWRTASPLPLLVLVLLVAGAATALRCWHCGQYSDGVGSITPCANHSAAQLQPCAPGHNYCIKYVSELTIVRDCVPTCTEKEWWGARTFCCDTDDCNAGPRAAALDRRLLVVGALLLVGGALLQRAR